ncbi:hypothetical protein P280DRAFT_469825 [Massarina eburnea CBS 473.64]|uniref:Uncharacterized protein n=1 Tax=Massarina eburnea CBS 473.64 TaxID=1395130 RepID=A0A6A6S1K8_9PLEO|nr:hypothetical protein P280DRAFT_469825 [Massarina eburnea CBS 473.64]
MKFGAATTLLFVTFALASPAPVAQPEVEALVSRADASVPAPEIDVRAVGLRLEERKSKPKTSNGGNTTSSAVIIAPSRALKLGAFGLGFIEIVQLWG